MPNQPVTPTPSREAVNTDAATADQIERANEAVTANLDANEQPLYDSTQGYACALTAIMLTDAARPSDGANLDKFSWAFTPATPPQGLVDYINLTVRDGKLRVSARQGNGAPNGLHVGFDLPIEALHELAAKFATPSDHEAVERVKALRRSNQYGRAFLDHIARSSLSDLANPLIASSLLSTAAAGVKAMDNPDEADADVKAAIAAQTMPRAPQAGDA